MLELPELSRSVTLTLTLLNRLAAEELNIMNTTVCKRNDNDICINN